MSANPVLSAAIPMNPDQQLIRQWQANPGVVEVTSNPFAVALGTQLEQVDATEGRVALRFNPGPLFIQGAGVLQGGAITAMLDFAMAFATLAQIQDGQSCASICLTTSFLRPATAGRLKAVGQVTKRGRQIVFASAELFNESDVLVASATSTLAVG